MTAAIRLSTVPLVYDARAISRRVGLILLGTDHTSEADFARMVASQTVGVFATRVAYANPVTPDNLRAMQPRLAAAAAMLLPDDDLDVVCFSCTSASVVIGDGAVEDAIREGKPGVRVVTPPSAAASGLRALGAQSISILTPYTQETSAPMAGYFEAAGFAVDRLTCMGLEDDREMARLSPATLVEAALDALDPASDALFISCTALRAACVAARIEAQTGRLVVTSNQATAWACLSACGIAPNRPEWGQLMALAPEGRG